MAPSCVASVPIFSGLEPSAQEAIAERLVHRAFAAGEVIALPGDAPALRVVHSGRMRQSRASDTGVEKLLRILAPGDFTGQGAVLTGRREALMTTAMSAVTVCQLTAADLAAVLREQPGVALGMLVEVSERLTAAEEQLAAITGQSVMSRLGQYLAALAASADSDTIVLPMTKRDLASFLGTTPETLSRRLRRLEDERLIEQRPGGVIRVRAADALAAVQ